MVRKNELGQTINKDGSIRKQGSGRPKGANSLMPIAKKQLEHLNDNDILLVGRVWAKQNNINLEATKTIAGVKLHKGE